MSGADGHRPDLEGEVLRYLQAGPASGNALCRAIRARRQDVWAALHALETAGRVKRTRARADGAGTGSRRRWKIVHGGSPTSPRQKQDRFRVELTISEAAAIALGTVPERVRQTVMRKLDRRRQSREGAHPM